MRIVTAAPLLLLLAWVMPHPWPGLEVRTGLALLALALVPGLAALLIYYRGLRHTRASLAAVAELCFPATAGLLNWILLGTGVSAVQVAGFVVLWAAILAI
jgi:drug/metabolite transporter (DMT)-like permease